MPITLRQVALIGIRTMFLAWAVALFMSTFPDTALKVLPPVIVQTGIEVILYGSTLIEKVPGYLQTVIHVLDETFTTISLIPYAEYLVAIASISQHIFQTCGTTAKQVMFATHWFNVMVDRFVDPQYALVVKVMVHMVLLTYLRDIIHRLYLGLRFLLEAPTFIRGLGRLFRWLVVSYKNEFLATNPFLRDAVPYAAGPLAQDVVVASQADSNRRGPGRVVE